jgi:hypothetical protein
MTKIAVILPSRGLIFSQTADEILQNVRGMPHRFFFAHRRPIPDCFEEPTRRALADPDITHLWFTEDDMVLPPNTLVDMLAMDVAAVTADYPTTKYGRGAVFKIKNKVIFCGTGCLLVKREVFDELQRPYFRTDTAWNIKNYGSFVKMRANRTEGIIEGYGLHDVNFCMALYDRNIPIHELPLKLSQRKLKALGRQGTNNGAHNIEIWSKIVKDELLKKVKSWPVEPSGDLVTILVDGKELLTNAKHATKLIRKKLAVRAPKRPLVVDWSLE